MLLPLFDFVLLFLCITTVEAWSLERRDAPVVKATPIEFPYDDPPYVGPVKANMTPEYRNTGN
jgi:hypothetical protein